MSTLLEDNRRVLDHPEGKEVVIQHDFDFYSVAYYKEDISESVYFLKDPATGKFSQLLNGHWYMTTVLEKLSKIPVSEKHLITKTLVNSFWYAIREGYNHMLDPNLKNAYDTPRIQNNIKAVQAYIKRIADKENEKWKGTYLWNS